MLEAKMDQEERGGGVYITKLLITLGPQNSRGIQPNYVAPGIFSFQRAFFPLSSPLARRVIISRGSPLFFDPGQTRWCIKMTGWSVAAEERSASAAACGSCRGGLLERKIDPARSGTLNLLNFDCQELDKSPSEALFCVYFLQPGVG